PAAGTLAPGTDPAPEESSTQAPVADADMGEGTQLDNDVNPDSSRAAETETTEAADAGTAEPAAPEVVATPRASTQDRDAGDEITMEDVLAASDEQLARKPVHRGMITTGTIIMLA